MKIPEIEQFVSWLIIQPNANGKLFLEGVARSYASAIRYAPLKLDISLASSERNVYSCKTLDAYNRLYKIFRSAPNFQAVNRAAASGAFLAGLNAYKRYLKSEVAKKVHRVNFACAGLYSDTIPDRCVINGVVLTASSWAQMLVAVSEHLLVKSNKNFTIRAKSGNKRLYLMDEPIVGLRCAKLSNGRWIVVNYSAPQKIKWIGVLCEKCSIDTSKVELYYVNKLDIIVPVSLNIDNMEYELNKARVAPSSEFDSIIDFDEGKNALLNVLNMHFRTLHGYSNIGILWNAAQNELPMFLNDNAIDTDKALWSFVFRAFNGEFVFANPHIWRELPPYPLSVYGLVLGLAERCGGIVNREQIDNYFSQIKMNSPTNAFLIQQKELVFCARDSFMRLDVLDFTPGYVKIISTELNKLFTREGVPYIILRDIREEWFSRLPKLPCGEWTHLLLQEVLRICSGIGYRAVSPSLKRQHLATLSAAVVPENSDIKTFADVVHRHCHEKYDFIQSVFNLSTEDLRLELRNAGMIEGNELINNMHKALRDHRFVFDNEKINVKIRER
jgi:hypothetical protein